MMSKSINFILKITVLLFCSIFPIAVHAQLEQKQAFLFKEDLLDQFSYQFYTQIFSNVTQPANSALNANNRFEISRYSLGTDLRLDLFFESEAFDISLKPRLEIHANNWKDGFVKGDDEIFIDSYIYETAITLKFDHDLFASYGRENLQWGPSSLLSPSNPFNHSNNQNTPNREMQGMDYAKLIWVPSYNFSASFIANTGVGRFKQLGDKFINTFDNEFKHTYAFKFDYTGNNYYLSLIPSYQKDKEKFRLGYIGQWNLNDAVFLYSEGSVFEKQNDFAVLLGGAYTFVENGTITFEYFYHQNGCTLDPVYRCYAPLSSESLMGIYIRKDYLQLNYYNIDFLNNFDLILRWTYGVNDHSNLASSYIRYNINDNIELFGIFTGVSGGVNDELNGLVDYSITLGIGYSL
ncbi:MAG: hypothetical protein QM504_00665 [Pseudomonadota bacterium]